MRRFGRITAFLAILVFCAAAPALAQLEDNLSAYTDETAKGYLKPLQEAFGQALNSNFYTTAHIPRTGLRLRVEVRAMSVMFKNSDDRFRATTGGDFQPQQTVDAPTVVGPEQSVSVSGDGGTEFVFPGGFDLSSFTIAVPQITVGSFAGTEASLRWIAFDTGDAEIGNISLFGIGARHSLSQYLIAPPVDLAAGVYYQKLNVGDDLLKANSFTVGVQASRDFANFTPYGGLSLDTFALEANYTATAGAEDRDIHLDFGSKSSLHLSAGVGVNLGVVHLNVGGDISDRVGVNAGLAVGL
jgi:hypothetical protein